MPRNNTRALIAAAVVGVVLIVILKVTFGSKHSSTPKAAAQPRKGCDTVTVAASPEKAAIMSQIADNYNRSNRTVNGKCFGINIVPQSSGAAEQKLADGWDPNTYGTPPDAWTPAASFWLNLLTYDLTKSDKPNLLPDSSDNVSTTPLVLAMPQPMAEALGWPKGDIGWSDVYGLATNPAGWGSKGHPEWGKFVLGKTNPNISTAGLAATVGAFVAATGTSSDLKQSDLTDPKIKTFVSGVESAVVHYGDNTLTYLANLQRADDAGAAMSYVSAVAVEEKSVLDYNNGNPSGDPKTLGQHGKPRVPLVAVYPKEGTLYSDSPYAILKASWSTSDRQSGAKDFLDFVREAAQQKVFTDAGFRTWDKKAGDAVNNSKAVIADGVKITLTPPNPTVLAGVRSTWADLRKPAKILLLMDVSGSMGDAAGSSGSTKLQLAQAAAVKAIDQLAPRDQLGLWEFTTNLDSPEKYRKELVPIAPLSQDKTAIVNSIKAMQPLSGTPLYAAIRNASDFLSQNADASAINAVVVLTDGRNEYPQDNDLAGLVSSLKSRASEGGVRVFSIAYGADADLSVLRQISEASRAAAYDATKPETIDSVFTNVLSNF